MVSRTRFLSIIAASFATVCLLGPATSFWGKEKSKDKPLVVDANDPTVRLFQLLDASHDGKLKGLYVIADVRRDLQNPDREVQRVLRVEYDKARLYGRLNIYARVVDKLGPEQLKSYTPQLIYDFGAEDVEKFTKTEAGPFGMTGDTYFLAKMDSPLTTAPVTDEVRQAYEALVSQYVLPALSKK